MTSWILLLLAIVLEVMGTTSMKLSNGFSNWLPSILMFIFYGISFTCFVFAIKKIDVSTSYALWSGLGTALIALIGIFYFRESVNTLKIISLLLIIAGVIGLRLSGGDI